MVTIWPLWCLHWYRHVLLEVYPHTVCPVATHDIAPQDCFNTIDLLVPKSNKTHNHANTKCDFQSEKSIMQSTTWYGFGGKTLPAVQVNYIDVQLVNELFFWTKSFQRIVQTSFQIYKNLFVHPCNAQVNVLDCKILKILGVCNHNTGINKCRKAQRMDFAILSMSICDWINWINGFIQIRKFLKKFSVFLFLFFSRTAEKMGDNWGPFHQECLSLHL